jgi:rsbT antagonist protein RsbS
VSERVPIIRIGKVLLASVQVDLSDDSAVALQEDLSVQIVAAGAKAVIVDISSLEIVDSFIGRMLAAVAAVSRILDADTIVVGMRPAVAITLTELGLSLPGIRTALNAERAFAMLGMRMESGDGESFDEEFAEEDAVVTVATSAEL